MREFRIDRRCALARIGGGALAFLPLSVVRAAGDSAMPACIATPAQTEGPYFVDERMNRADVRADPTTGAKKEGVPLKLTLVAHAINGGACAALAGAIVDIWHCDARGIYSDVDDAAGQKFLRGYQVTGSDGSVDFVTIYPGWYPGRTAHIHFKVRGRAPQGDGYELTSQLYFDEAASDRVYARAPYKSAGRRTRNDDDFVYRHDGKALTLALSTDGDGYSARFDIGLRIA